MAIPTSPRTVVTTSGDPALSVFAPKPTIIPIGMGNTVLNITEVTNYVSQNTIVNQPGGGQDEVQVNVGGRFVGDAGMTYNATDDALTVDGNVSVGGTLFTDVLKYANGTNWSFTGTYTNSNVASYLPTYSGLVGGTLSTAAQPNITSVGTLSSLTTTTITTGANITAGTLTGNWTLSTGSKLQSTYADLAERYVSDFDYLPGTVLEFGGPYEVTLGGSDTTRVAGVVSQNAAYIMNASCEGSCVVDLALQGRVKVFVLGAVSKGDMLISAGAGYAYACQTPKLGQVIGKSLENRAADSDNDMIEVVVGRM